jgi:hypothetical protein
MVPDMSIPEKPTRYGTAESLVFNELRSWRPPCNTQGRRRYQTMYIGIGGLILLIILIAILF